MAPSFKAASVYHFGFADWISTWHLQTPRILVIICFIAAPFAAPLAMAQLLHCCSVHLNYGHLSGVSRVQWAESQSARRAIHGDLFIFGAFIGTAAIGSHFRGRVSVSRECITYSHTLHHPSLSVGAVSRTFSVWIWLGLNHCCPYTTLAATTQRIVLSGCSRWRAPANLQQCYWAVF